MWVASVRSVIAINLHYWRTGVCKSPNSNCFAQACSIFEEMHWKLLLCTLHKRWRNFFPSSPVKIPTENWDVNKRHKSCAIFFCTICGGIKGLTLIFCNNKIGIFLPMYHSNHGNCAIEYCKYSIAILFLKNCGI